MKTHQDTCDRCGLPLAEDARDLSRYDEKCRRHIPTLANQDGCEWAAEKRRKLMSEPMVAAALDAERRRATTVEAAMMRVVDILVRDWEHEPYPGTFRHSTSCPICDLWDAIRAA